MSAGVSDGSNGLRLCSLPVNKGGAGLNTAFKTDSDQFDNRNYSVVVIYNNV